MDLSFLWSIGRGACKLVHIKIIDEIIFDGLHACFDGKKYLFCCLFSFVSSFRLCHWKLCDSSHAERKLCRRGIYRKRQRHRASIVRLPFTISHQRKPVSPFLSFPLIVSAHRKCCSNVYIFLEFLLFVYSQIVCNFLCVRIWLRFLILFLLSNKYFPSLFFACSHIARKLQQCWAQTTADYNQWFPTKHISHFRMNDKNYCCFFFLWSLRMVKFVWYFVCNRRAFHFVFDSHGGK